MVFLLFLKNVTDFLIRRFFLILWISLVTYIFYNSFIYYKEGLQFFYLRNILGLGLCVSRGTAAVLNICGALVLLPLCKKMNQLLYRALSKLWPGLFFFWLERAKSFHITVAITLLVFAVIHSVSHLYNLWNFSRGFDEVYREINLASYKNENPLRLLLSLPGLTGISMLILTTCMGVMSSRPIRRRLYNVFWYTHQLYLPFMVLLIVHPLSGVLKEEALKPNGIYSSQVHSSSNFTKAPTFVPIKSKTWLWMAMPLSCFFLDLIWRILSRNRARVDVIQITRMSGRTISLTLSCPDEEFQCRPGQYVLLQCPYISLLEWHPFTAVVIPTSNRRNFTLWIRVKGDWTESLENLLFLKRPDEVSMLVDGPFASPMQNARRCRVALCVAAGVGITPFVAMLRDMLRNPRGKYPGRLHLIWIVRHERELTWLAKLANSCLLHLRNANRPDRLHLELYITNTIANTHTIVNEKGVTSLASKDEEKATLLTPCIKRKTEKRIDKHDYYRIAKEYPILGCRVKSGRPYWDRVFGYWAHLYPEEHLKLFCCGPKKLVKLLRSKCKNISRTTKTKLTLVHEAFS